MHLAEVCATQNSLSPAREELHLGFKYGGLGKPLCESAIQKTRIPRQQSTHGPRQSASRLHRHLTRMVYITSDGARSLHNENLASSVH